MLYFIYHMKTNVSPINDLNIWKYGIRKKTQSGVRLIVQSNYFQKLDNGTYLRL